jgi:A/G-specific adenine glycosylase
MARSSGHVDPKVVRSRILDWYDTHRRDLPWRDSCDAWPILVSEIMLQQTTVAAVIPYFERFLARWPTAADLAAAGQDELLAEWAGLGYYGRAHRLQAAAVIVAESGGDLPGTRDELLALPGIGDYTAAAVASIAFGETVAAVDGNVERVVCRVLALADDPRRAAARRRLRSCAHEWLDPDRPGDGNQALMELGATVCRPRSPRCDACPLEDLCLSRRAGNPESYPQLPARRASVPVSLVAAVIERRGRWLLEHREVAPNAGFAELPMLEVSADRCDDRGRPRDARGELARHWASAHGLTLEVGSALPLHRHTITHHRIAVHPYRARLVAGRPSGRLFWCDPSIESTPLTTASRRILAGLSPRLSSRPTQSRP